MKSGNPTMWCLEFKVNFYNNIRNEITCVNKYAPVRQLCPNDLRVLLIEAKLFYVDVLRSCLQGLPRTAFGKKTKCQSKKCKRFTSDQQN